MSVCLTVLPPPELAVDQPARLEACLDRQTSEIYSSSYVYGKMTLFDYYHNENQSHYFGLGPAAIPGQVNDRSLFFSFNNWSIRRAGKYYIRVEVFLSAGSTSLLAETRTDNINVHDQHTNGISNGHSNGYTNGYTNGYANDYTGDYSHRRTRYRRY